MKRTSTWTTSRYGEEIAGDQLKLLDETDVAIAEWALAADVDIGLPGPPSLCGSDSEGQSDDLAQDEEQRSNKIPAYCQAYDPQQSVSWNLLHGNTHPMMQRTETAKARTPTSDAVQPLRPWDHCAVPDRHTNLDVPTRYHNNNLPEQPVAEELLKLDSRQREKVYEEIHGVAPTTVETDVFVEKSILKLQSQLRKMKSAMRRDYDRAAFLNPTYVKSTSFQLMFLRAECFDAPKAAKRIVLHFAEKRKLFGPGLLSKHITFQDLDEEAQKSVMLTEGPFMFHNCRDNSGRSFFVQRYVHEVGKNHETRRHPKALWYMVMSCLKHNVDTQRRGVNLILCTLGTNPTDFLFMFDVQKRNSSIFKSTPFRITACHFCVEHPCINSLARLVISFFPKDLRAHTKIHRGSTMECTYSMQGYGIGRGALPMDKWGRIDADFVDSWICAMRELERIEDQNQLANLPHGAILSPHVNDILMGRGLPYQTYTGNMQMVRLVDAKKKQYMRGNRKQRQQVTKSVIGELMHTYKARFLERRDGCWMQEHDAKRIHEKVAMIFRNAVRDL